MPHRVGMANVHKDQGCWIRPLCQLGTLRTGEDKGAQEQVASWADITRCWGVRVL